MLHSDLASGDPKNRPEDTVRWLSVAQYKVFGPRSKASRSPLLQTDHVRVFSRLPEHSPAVRLKHPFPINNRHGRSRTFLSWVLSSNLVESCLRLSKAELRHSPAKKSRRDVLSGWCSWQFSSFSIQVESLRFKLQIPRFRANPYLPPARTFHALLPRCPYMELPCTTPPAPENYIISKHAASSHHPAVFMCRRRGTGRFRTRSKRPAKPRGNG
jgi:hypothetical protein